MRSTILLASFLAILPLVSASPSRSLAARQAAPTVRENIGSFRHVGCYIDSETSRVLSNPVTPDGAFTADGCVNKCGSQSFTYAGVENAVSCFCATQPSEQLVNADPSDCEARCPGDSSEACGGFNRFLLYVI